MSKIFIISGPSGAGEDSVIEGLKKNLAIKKIVTTTTRKIRQGEAHGKDYYFVSKENFEKGIKDNNFFEWAKEYNNNLYGVTHKEINRVKNSNKIGIWKIEYKGVIYAKKVMPEILAIMINAPEEILIKRIKSRSSVSDKFIKERMEYNKEWIKNKDVYDYEITNEENKLEETIQKVTTIINNNLK